MKGTRLDGYLSLREAAALLKKSKQRVHIYVGEGRLDPIKFVDNFYLIKEDAVKSLKKALEESEKKN